MTILIFHVPDFDIDAILHEINTNCTHSPPLANEPYLLDTSIYCQELFDTSDNVGSSIEI